MLRSINSKKVEANEIHDSSLSLKEEVISHCWYENISKEMKKKIEKGNARKFSGIFVFEYCVS